MRKKHYCAVDHFFPHDGTGLWVIQADNLEQAQAVVNSSPRVRDGMLADSARVVEWEVHIGRDLFHPVPTGVEPS